MKRAISVFLSVILVLTLIPALAFGAGTVYFSAGFFSPGDPMHVNAAVGSSVELHVFLTPQDGDKTFSSYYFVVSYDAARLAFVSADFPNNGGKPVVAEAIDGILTVAGFGETRSDIGIKLTFKAIAGGDARVTLQRAFMDHRANAGRDAAEVSLPAAQRSVTVHCGGCTVTLPDLEGISGPSFVGAGGDYTFHAPAGFTYKFNAAIGQTPVPVRSNGDGSYTVENVTGDLVITLSDGEHPVPREYGVSFTGSGAEDVRDRGETACYNTDFHFTLTPDANYDYAVSATVGGKPVTLDISGDTYIIPGTSILGDIAVTVFKAPKSETTQLVFVGNGAEDVVGGGGVHTVANHAEHTFAIAWRNDCEYAVTARSSSGKLVTVTESAAKDGSYTIPGSCITGGIITVTVTRAAPSETDVSVGKFLELSNGRVLFLIQAASQTTLPAGKDLYYNGYAMFWSQEYGSFVYLAEGASSTAAAADDAASLITVGSTGHTTVERYGDANGSGTVDINDAQYIYDLCSHQTAPTLAARSDIAQLLCADVNHNGELEVADARAVVYRIQ